MANIKISGAVYPLALNQSTSPNGTEIVPADSVVSGIRNTYGFTFSSLLGPLAVNYTSKTATFSGATSGSAVSITGGNYSTGVGLSVTGGYTGVGTTGLVTISDTGNTNGVNLRMVGNGSTTPSKTIRVITPGLLQITNDAYNAVLWQITDYGATTFNSTSGAPITVATTPAGSYAGLFYGSSTTGSSYGILSVAGSNSSDFSFVAQSKSGSNLFQVRGDGVVAATASSISSFVGPATAWQFDWTGASTTSGTNEISLANNASLSLPVGSGLVVCYEIAPSSQAAYAFLAFGSAYVTNIAGSSFTGTLGTSGKINIGYTGGLYVIQNLTGSTITAMSVSLLKFRAFT